jgi:hypothetical protein
MTPPFTEEEMLKHITDEVRYIRQRLDKHIDDETVTLDSLRDDIANLKAETAVGKTKLGIVISSISLVLAGAVSWLTNHLSR